jgi:formylglycine-generating enzyme required for sulfatase activity
VHILDDAPDKKYAGEKFEYNVKYIDMATIPKSKFDLNSNTIIGSGPFKSAVNYTIKAFELGQYEVTYELWYAVYKWAIAKGYQFSDRGLGITEKNGDKGAPPTNATRYIPVHGIDWADAIVWCNAFNELLYEINPDKELNPLTFPYLKNDDPVKSVMDDVFYVNTNNSKIKPNPSQGAFRLPSETEWEFAARGANPSTDKGTPWQSKYAGGDSVADVAWINDGVHSPDETTNTPNTPKTPVKITNPEGKLYNMSGNVWEWCQSDDLGFVANDDLNQNLKHLKRGGAYNSTMPDPNNPNDKTTDYLANNSSRDNTNAKDTGQNTGFRLARWPAPKPTTP